MTTDTYCAAVVDDIAERLREVAELIPAEFRDAANHLHNQAKLLAEAVKATADAQTEAALHRAVLESALKATTGRRRAERVHAEHTRRATPEAREAAQRNVRRIDFLLEVASRNIRPRRFLSGDTPIDAGAVELVLSGRCATLRPSDKAYLYARISVLGGLSAIDLSLVAAAADTTGDLLSRTYYQYWKRIADLREVASGARTARQKEAA